MNRRNFLKRGAVGAAAAAIVTVPIIDAEVVKPKSDFPETKEDMWLLVHNAEERGEYVRRMEGALIEEGLNRTDTGISTHWYYHKGNRVAVLHIRERDNHVCFSVERMEAQQAIYTPPLKTQWARNRRHDMGIEQIRLDYLNRSK